MSTPTNVLSKYHSYSYYHVLAICDRTVTADALSQAQSADVWTRVGSSDPIAIQSISTSDSTNAGSRPGQYVILVNGATDAHYVISSAKWMGVTAAEATSLDYGTSCAIEGSINVDEPRGIIFCDEVVAACLALGTDPATAVWVLKTFFVGYYIDEFGNGSTELISDVTPVQFIVYDLIGNFTEAGGQYELSFVAVTNGASRLPQYSRATNGLTLATGAGNETATVSSAIREMFNKISKQYSIHYNCFMSFATAQADQLPPEEREEEVSRYYPVIYEFDFDGSDYMEDVYAVTDQPQQFKDQAGCNAAPTLKLPSNIEDALHLILRSSPAVLSEITKGRASSSASHKYEYKILSTVETSYGTSTDTQPTARVVYQIKKYPVPKEAPSSLFDVYRDDLPDHDKQLHQNLVEFDYIYSGKNIDVLSFDMKLSFGLAYLQTATLSNTFAQQMDVLPRRSTQVSQYIDQSRRFEDGTGARRRSFVPVFFGTQIRNPTLNNTSSQSNTAQAAWTMSKHASLEVTDVTMTIIGNPRLLGSLNRVSGKSGLNDQHFLNVDAATEVFPHWHRIPAYAKVNIYMPSSNDDLQLMQSSTGNYSKKFWFDGLYHVIAVEHSFEHGQFTQDLSMIGLPRPSDFSTVSKREEHSQNVEEYMKWCSDGGSNNALQCNTPTSNTKSTVAIPAPRGPATPSTEGERLVASSWEYKCVGPQLIRNWHIASDEVKAAIDVVSKDDPFLGNDPLCTAQYLAAVAFKESSFKPHAVHPKTLNATGLYQFLIDTWNGLYPTHKNDIWRRCGYEGHPPADRTTESLALRSDPLFSTYMMARFTKGNMRVLGDNIDVSRYGGGDLYMSHVLGSGGARTVLRAVYSGNPHMRVTDAYAQANTTKINRASAERAIQNNPIHGLNLESTCNDARLIFCYALYANTTDVITSSFVPPPAAADLISSEEPAPRSPRIEQFESKLSACQMAAATSDPENDNIKPDNTNCDE